MNRSVFQSSSLVQQMMAENPNNNTNNWWNMNTMRPPSSPFLPFPPPNNNNFFPQYTPPPPPPPTPPPPTSSWNDNQELPESWSQMLLGGLVGEEDKLGLNNMQPKKFQNWEDQMLVHQDNSSTTVGDVKQENSVMNYVYGHGNVEFQAAPKPTWSQMMPVSSPKSSCVTNLSNKMLDFSSKSDARHPPPDHSSECNSTAPKKARVQPSSTQSTFKVRKEKLGDRITALHQIVSPFGKTDTASVLLEAIGYVRFLQNQVEALSLPYLGNGSGNMRQHQHVHQGDGNCLFPEDPGQLLNDNCMKKKATFDQDSNEEPKKDLKSRGLCLVPISCTQQVGSDNGADYWAPAAFSGGFR